MIEIWSKLFFGLLLFAMIVVEVAFYSIVKVVEREKIQTEKAVQQAFEEFKKRHA